MYTAYTMIVSDNGNTVKLLYNPGDARDTEKGRERVSGNESNKNGAAPINERWGECHGWGELDRGER